jgi:hypothetical protein
MLKQKLTLWGICVCAFFGLLLPGGCENVYIQELLRGDSILDGLGLVSGTSVFNLQPAFRSDYPGPYYIRVPHAVDKIQIRTAPRRDGTARFTRTAITPATASLQAAYTGPVSIDIGETNDTGEFDFPLDAVVVDDIVEEQTIEVEVTRPHMDPLVYTIVVIRGSDLLADLQPSGIVFIGASSAQEGAISISPGYSDDVYEYTFYAQKATEQIKLTAVKTAPVKVEFLKVEHASVTCPTGPILPGTTLPPGWEEPGPGDAGPAPGGITDHNGPDHFSVRFAATIGVPTDFYIKVWNDDNAENTITIYKVSVAWPFSVGQVLDTAMPGGAPSGSQVYPVSAFTLNYDPDIGPFYDPGNPVSFTLSPPFGAVTSKVVYVTGDNVEHPITVQPNDEYNFVMPPQSNVKIRAAYRFVPAPGGNTVRFVSPEGAGIKDGSNWSNAYPGSELQNLMDGAAGGNYEIWLAAGNYCPDWSESDTARDRIGWASGLSVADTDYTKNWAFVLTNGVRLYGGFRGTETSIGERVYTTPNPNNPADVVKPFYETVLSGDLPDDIVFHTMIAAGAPGDSAYLDGLTIDAPANPYWPGTSITVNGRTITHNYGAVLYINTFDPVLKNVTLTGGLAFDSAGVYVSGDSRPVFLHCYLSDSQSAGEGSAVGITDTGHLLMVGGSMAINLDAGGVLYIGPQAGATLVNVSIVNNKDAPVYGTGTGTFINCTLTGNRWSNNGSPDVPYLVSTGKFYNSVIKNNTFITGAGTGTVTYAAGVTFANTIAQPLSDDGVNVISDTTPLVNNGDNGHYPLQSGGLWNTGYPEEVFFNSLPLAFKERVQAALMLDGQGTGPRFKNGTIDLGALEK